MTQAHVDAIAKEEVMRGTAAEVMMGAVNLLWSSAIQAPIDRRWGEIVSHEIEANNSLIARLKHGMGAAKCRYCGTTSVHTGGQCPNCGARDDQ